MGIMSAIRRSAILDGMARLMDFEGILVEPEENEELEAAARNLHRDWQQIGMYTRAAMNQVARDDDRR